MHVRDEGRTSVKTEAVRGEGSTRAMSGAGAARQSMAGALEG